MSKILKKIAGPKTLVSVKMDSMELMGSAVAEKDMFCVHWTMKGLRGRESTGDTENVRAAVSDGVSYPVARFNDVFAGEVHPKARKDGNGYDAMEFEMRVVAPALHKKDEKIIGKALVNIFEKVPVLTPGQPHQAEQTVGLTKDGTAVAHIKLTLSIKGDAPADDVEVVEADQPTSPSSAEPPASPQKEVPNIVVKTPPATPQKEAGSELGSSGTSDVKEESESKSRHRKRRSSNSSAMMAAQLKRKEEELKQKEEEHEEEKKKLNEQLAEKSTEIEDLKKANQHLETRVKELEQSKEQTDVVPINPVEEKMQDDLRRIQAQNEELSEQKLALVEQKEESDKKVAELTEALEAARKELEEAKNQPAAAAATSTADESKDKELALLKEQLAELKAELGKKGDAPEAAAAPAKSNIVMQAVIAAVGALLGIILGRMI